jgi:hypothetical protein
MYRCFALDNVFGSSSTSRSGFLAVTTTGFTGVLSITSTRTSSPSRTTFMSSTVAVPAILLCAAAQDTRRRSAPNCFSTAVIRSLHSLLPWLPPKYRGRVEPVTSSTSIPRRFCDTGSN